MQIWGLEKTAWHEIGISGTVSHMKATILRREVIIMREPCQVTPFPPAKQGWCQTLDYNPTLYLLGIDGFQCRSYCMHAELWHTTYCCTVADLASIFLNVKRFHCMCKLSTFLLTFFYNLTICIGKVSSVVNNCHAFTTLYLHMYVLFMLSHHLGQKKVNEENWTQIGLDRLCKS